MPNRRAAFKPRIFRRALLDRPIFCRLAMLSAMDTSGQPVPNRNLCEKRLASGNDCSSLRTGMPEISMYTFSCRRTMAMPSASHGPLPP